MKMDVKTDDILNEIDPDLLLSYDLDKMTLENISNDIFEEPDEVTKFTEYRDNKNLLFLSDDAKINKSDTASFCEDTQNSTPESPVAGKLLSNCENEEEYPNTSEIKKDVNGNEDPLADENFNNLLHRLNLSDSDNEAEEYSENQTKEDNKDSSLRERAPISRKRSKNQNQIPYNRKEYDKNQFNPQSLRFLSGSNCVLLPDIKENNHYSVPVNSAHVIEGINCLIPEPNTNDQFYDPVTTSVSVNIFGQNKIVIPDCGITDLYSEDSGTNSVRSPESGYETSITGSPPCIASNSELDFFADNVDEQDFLDLVVEIENATDCASNPCNFLDDQEKILDYLKATENECKSKSVDIVINNENKEKQLCNLKNSISCMSVINNVDLSSISPVTSASVSGDSSQSSETPIACKPLNDKAKTTLYAVLSDDKIRAVQKRIYKDIIKQIREDAKEKDKVKVICIENETENRTNLHTAVLNCELEEVYCLVEIHKQYKKPFSDLNVRDKSGKTPLDYALQRNLTLVAEYLKENNCCPSVNI